MPTLPASLGPDLVLTPARPFDDLSAPPSLSVSAEPSVPSIPEHIPPQRPEAISRSRPVCQIKDTWGYQRNPAFWYTLNCPYNYLLEIHRFRSATCVLLNSTRAHQQEIACVDVDSRSAMADRCAWVLDNPDIVATLHAIRVENLVRCVLQHIVPLDKEKPFHYWLRIRMGCQRQSSWAWIGICIWQPAFRHCCGHRGDP